MYSGPHIIKSGLGIAIDASSTRGIKSAAETNLLDYSTWTVGNTSATGFGRNGTSSENLIETGTGPYGENAVLWKAYNTDASSNADGGWNSSQFNVDLNSLYRYSVWVKRNNNTNGRFYLGCRGYNSGGSNIGVGRRDSTSTTTNPYFWTDITSFTANLWYLVVGHVWPVGTGIGDEHPDSGRHTIASGKVGNISRDYVWLPNTTKAVHRSYLYYATDANQIQWWAYPRVDKIDGTEPSITELLGGNTRQYTNLKNKNQKFFLRNKLRVRAASNIGKSKVKKFEFDGTDDAIKVEGGTTSSLQRSFELVFRVNSVPATYTPIAVFTRESGGTEGGKRVWLGLQSNKFRMHGWGTTDPASTTSVTNGDYYHCVYAYDQSTKKHYIWVNGVLEDNSTNTQGGQTGWTNTSGLFWWLGHDPQASNWTGAAGSHFDGDIAIFKTYSKILSNNEVKQNFRAYRRRFDI